MVTSFSRGFAALALGLAWASPGRTEAISANALALLDAYVAQAARSLPADRANIVLGECPHPPPGRFLANSAWLGPFTYRPKAYRELSGSDRAALLRDPAWPAFLATHRPAPVRPRVPPPDPSSVSGAPILNQPRRDAAVAGHHHHPAPAVSPPDLPQLPDVLGAVQAQVVAALWLSFGMICAFAAIVCVALSWRRAALVCGFFYSLTLCFLSNGHAQVLGPIGGAVALTGLFWPRGKFRA